MVFSLLTTEKVHRRNNKILPTGVLLTDFPVDPPSNVSDPWICDFPASLDYTFRSQDGVIQVYASADAEHPAQGFPYPNLETFNRDMERMCAIMVNGPLLV